MELFLIGHEYRYCVEQTLLMLYPGERPTYPEKEGEGDRAVVALTRGREYTTAVCRLTLKGKTERGAFRIRIPEGTAKTEAVRREQHAVKLAFYRAALAQGHEKPAWGCLTGVRPGKFLTGLRVRDGLTDAQALRALIKQYDVSPDRALLCRDAERTAQRVRASLSKRDVCLYIGIPYCPTRCAYCSFVSVEAPKLLKTIPDYLAALEKELAATAGAVKKAGLRIVAVYMGGGTPTTLSANELDRLLSVTHSLFDLSACREITVEAGRPDTVTEEKLRVLRAQGVDRVSVNPQTMSDTVLETIGRHHTAADIVRAVELVKRVGGLSFNMDLIAGLPGDTPESFEDTLRAVLALDPENITVHTLALKKGSRFLTEHTLLPDGAAVGTMLRTASDLLGAAQYAPYYLYRQKYMSGSFENVGWTKSGHENIYNVCIMEELCSILSAGAGGSTKLVHPNGDIQRLTAPKYPREYIERIEETCADKEVIARL